MKKSNCPWKLCYMCLILLKFTLKSSIDHLNLLYIKWKTWRLNLFKQRKQLHKNYFDGWKANKLMFSSYLLCLFLPIIESLKIENGSLNNFLVCLYEPCCRVLHSTELNSICRILRREVCQEVKVGSLTTYSACTSPHYGHIRSTCGDVTNITISEDFSSQKSANRVGLWTLSVDHTYKNMHVLDCRLLDPQKCRKPILHPKSLENKCIVLDDLGSYKCEKQRVIIKFILLMKNNLTWTILSHTC